jgi:hypothetical protein
MDDALQEVNLTTSLAYEYYLLAKSINSLGRYKIFLALNTGVFLGLLFAKLV